MSFWDTDAFWTDADTDDFADLSEDASPDQAVITRRTGTTSDGKGGRIDVWTVMGTLMVKISAVGQSPAEQVMGQQLQGVSDVMISLPTGTNVRNGDRVTVDGQVYDVEGVAPTRSWEARRRVYASAIGAKA